MKRLLGMLLALTILFSLCAVGVQADQVLATSDEAVRILKLEEGFSKTPYWDYAQWTVGYGTKCPDDKLEEYRQNGISEEAAEALLRTYISRFESELYSFMIRTGVQLNQNQFDALMLFSYNCGTAWAYSTTGGLYNAVVSGATGNELIDALTRWCNAGGQIKTFLLRRRLSEANIYLNGEYSQTPPENFGYVLYDACGGTTKPNVQGYDAALTSQIIPEPVREGYTFAGWYTEKLGGTKVELLDASVRNSRLYARWTNGDAPQEPEKEEGITVTVNANGVNIRSGPGTDYEVLGKAYTGDQMVITETAEGSGYTWGKFRDGWICLDFTNYEEKNPQKPQEPTKPATRMGTVQVNDCLRVRSGPSTGYEVVAYLNGGDRVEILEEKLVGTMVWGRIEKGWISLSYVKLDPETETQPPETQPPETQPPETQPPETQPPQTQPPETQPPEIEPPTEPPVEPAPVLTGTVKVNDFLRVRGGPGTDYSVVGYMKPGQRVTITEKTVSGSMTWGKTEAGWISLSYVQLDPEKEEPAQVLTGTVKVNDLLRVRSGPGTSYAIAAYLKNGDKVRITEERTVGATRWGKIDRGWISLDYVRLDKAEETPQVKTMTVTADCLRIRSGPGTGNTIVGYLYAGARVEILETTTVNGSAWGKTAKGWISMSYVK